MSALLASFALAAFLQTAPTASSQAPGAAADGPEKGSLAGHVTNAMTGEPVKKARVTLTRTGSTGATAVATTDSVITDASGSFEFLNVYPGDCTLIASRPGFAGAARASSSGTGTQLRIALAPGEKATGLQLRIPPQGVIAGRVVDENGEPAGNVYVAALRPTYAQGVRTLNSAGISSGSTNDLGEYRIYGLTPGRYYVQARAATSSVYAAGLPATPDRTYPAVYYPGARDLDTAMRVEVRAGTEAGAINFTLKPARAATVRGRVVDAASNQPPQRASVSIYSASASSSPMGAPTSGASGYASTNAKGEFEITGVLPGAYAISASGMLANRAVAARDAIVVPDAGLAGVLLRLTPGASVAGTVRADNAAGFDFTKLRVSVGGPISASLLTLLNRASAGAVPGMVVSGASGTASGSVPPSFSAQYPGSVDAQGNYVFENVPPTRTQVYVNGLPDPFYLKSALLDDQETVHAGFEATGAGRHRLDLVVSGDGAQLDGTVLDKDKPAGDATVALIPADPALRPSVRLYRSIDTAQNGQFSLTAIPPGKYLVFAWEGVENGSWFDPDFMARYEKLGESVSLDGKEHKTVSLKLLSTTEEPSR